MLTPRPYQLDATDRARQAFKRTKKVILVAPTGAGKTVIAAHIIGQAYALDNPVLFLAHRQELIDQTYDKLTLDAGLPERHVGVIMSGDRRNMPQAPIQVASVDTLRNRPKPRATIVITDECHRAVNKSYTDIYAHYPDAYFLGLTATPMRLDRKSLRPIADELVIAARVSTLIEASYLANPKVFGAPHAVDLSKVHTKGADYDQAELADVMSDAKLIGDAVSEWLRLAQGRRTVAFCVDIEHAKKVRDAFLAAGVRAEHVDGTTDPKERRAILARLASGETEVVTNVGILCEGWDLPACKCLLLLRPTQSTCLYLQQAGRILRPYIDPVLGEPVQPLILDHARNVEAHGFPQDDRDYDLEPAKKRRPGMAPVRTCPQCFAVLPATTATCPHCAHVFRERANVTEATHVELVELTPQSRHDVYRLLIAECKGTAWANAAFKRRFGTNPPRDWMPLESGEPTERQKFYRDQWLSARAKGWKEKAADMKFKARFGMWPNQWDKAFARIEAEYEIPAPIEGSPAPFAEWVKKALEG